MPTVLRRDVLRDASLLIRSLAAELAATYRVRSGIAGQDRQHGSLRVGPGVLSAAGWGAEFILL